jgi:hypothetical protein
MLTLTQTSEPVRAPRHPLAYLFALTSAGGRGGTGTNFLMMIAIVAVLMGIALPAVTAARKRSEEPPSRSWLQPKLPLPVPGARQHQQRSQSNTEDEE